MCAHKNLNILVCAHGPTNPECSNWFVQYCGRMHLLYNPGNNYTVCTKGSRFPYILLPIQEAFCLFGCHDYATMCACARRPAYARLILYVCDHNVFTINCTTACLYGAAVILAFRAGPPKVIGPSKGHGGKQHIIA